jgi:hypothetical protein
VTLPASICDEVDIENILKLQSADETLQLMVLDNNHVVTFSLNTNITHVLFVTVKRGYWNYHYCVAALSVFNFTHFTYLFWNNLPKYNSGR